MLLQSLARHFLFRTWWTKFCICSRQNIVKCEIFPFCPYLVNGYIDVCKMMPSKCVAWTEHFTSTLKTNTHSQKNKRGERTLKSLLFEIQPGTVQMSAFASCVNLKSFSHLLCVINSELKPTVMPQQRPLSRKTCGGLWGTVKQNFFQLPHAQDFYLRICFASFFPSWTRKTIFSSRSVPYCPAHMMLFQWCFMAGWCLECGNDRD